MLDTSSIETIMYHMPKFLKNFRVWSYPFISKISATGTDNEKFGAVGKITP